MGLSPANTIESAAAQAAICIQVFLTNSNSKFMVTVMFTIKPYLAKYMYVRYRQFLEIDLQSSTHSKLPAPIHLSHLTPIYHFLYQLSVPHPQDVSWKESGNICFVLPKPRNGKIRKYIIIWDRTVSF